MPEFDAPYQRPDRQGALEAARALYPNASEQRLEEVLWSHTNWPYGDLAQWKIQLATQYHDSHTVFPDATPAKSPG